MPVVTEFQNSRLLPLIEGMMEFALQIYRHKKGHKTSPQFSEEGYPLPDNLKKSLKDALYQLEFSAMLKEYISLAEIPNSTEQISEYMRRSFELHNDPELKTEFVEWISLVCIISVACHENGCKEALCIGTKVIEERCESQTSIDEFKRLGCDV